MFEAVQQQNENDKHQVLLKFILRSINLINTVKSKKFLSKINVNKYKSIVLRQFSPIVPILSGAFISYFANDKLMATYVDDEYESILFY